ncbi:hypothetical protein AgCh_012778 [Apium graveolens]
MRFTEGGLNINLKTFSSFEQFLRLSVFESNFSSWGLCKFVYAYYVLKTITSIVCEGSVAFIALAYVADNITEKKRASTFGILSGISSCALVCGNLSTRFISTEVTFQAILMNWTCAARALGGELRKVLFILRRSPFSSETRKNLEVSIVHLSRATRRLSLKVTLDESPSKSIVNTSVKKCWETVMDELNQEFSRRQSLGNAISPFLDPQSINGLAMFGFLSPHIIQEIEALEPNHCCLE